MVLGTWEYVEKGKDWKETSICTYANDGTFNCEVEEHGCTKSGWCEAQSYSTSGTWLIANNSLTIHTTLFKKVHTQKLEIVSLKADNLVLKFSNQQQIWQRSSSAN
ncbi:hypothetical protein E2K93_08265 [Thalassotalea sp. HSM 43]|uniref:hypothetical protein n=1 Tax=Thalassotalea sp. HSM 43 TaxID=2552945 RepID=UPI0010819737|nr:hypothetical protein [Thalassotalea sp. HSM 43]QBY04384.1 hypothetical protein E2K93_08265 [Thalassotalea sp. HSM 43]